MVEGVVLIQSMYHFLTKVEVSKHVVLIFTQIKFIVFHP